MPVLPRRKIASYVAAEYASGNNVLPQVAAYLLQTKRLREVELLIRDIEHALLETGTVVADVTTARTLASGMKKELEAHLKQLYDTNDVQLRIHKDETLLGGITLETPDQTMDASLRARLETLKALKR